jgi:transcription initiation factor TFIID subunit 2
VLPQHIGIVIGPFEHVDLSEYRDTSEDDRLQDEAIKVHAFCLPGREDEVRNSAMMIARTLDSFTDRYQTYRFGKSYMMAFVEDLDNDTAHTMSLTICSSRLLFPENVWEPLEHTTRVLVHAVASQWIGVDVIAQSTSDHWVIVGGSWFMTEFYLRELFGRNDHRFRQKMIMDKIVQMDVRRPCLYDLGGYLHIDPGEQEFMELKSLSVLSILHNRLVKASGKNGVDRCIYRMLFNHGNGSLPNGAISTEAFMSVCEKVGHQKLDNFFRQWVYGSGCPIFECSPSFNKKKQVVVLTIKQMQGDPGVLLEDRSLEPSDFMREAKERSRGFYPDAEWPAFVGPMTIRIHEADGTPYEHIVEINSSQVRVEIPYNTKYKRLKRNRLQKERQAAAQGITLDASGEQQEEVTFYSLGDLFPTPEEIQEWRIEDWSPEDEQKMEQEAYEWIRIDADFEWICKTNIDGMPSYMYISQLQQDKDVVAQAETIQYLARKEGKVLLSTFMIKTLMDSRYFHGIRTMALQVLVNCATETAEMIGLFHLRKAFQELFCLPGSPMTRSNDFSDRALYLIQCAIPKAIAKIKGSDGKAPMEVKTFLLDLMRYNDNRGNDYSDDHYIATLMRCLTESITNSKPYSMSMDPTLNLLAEAEEHEFSKKAIDELERHLRLDEWIPTYQNIYTTTVLDCEVRLIKNRVNPLKVSDFLQYTQIGNAENVRLKAWECLVRLGVFNTRDSVVEYFIHSIRTDPSPYFRSQMLRIFDTAVGQVAVGRVFELNEPVEKIDGLAIEEEVGVSDRAAELARRKLDGALQGLRNDLQKNEILKRSVEDALRSATMSVRDVSELLDFSSLVVNPLNELKVRLEYPWYYKVERIPSPDHQLLLRFRRTHIRTKPTHPRQQPTALPPPPIAQEPIAALPASSALPKVKLTIKSKPKEPAVGSAPNPEPPPPRPNEISNTPTQAERALSNAAQSLLPIPNVQESTAPPKPAAPSTVPLPNPPAKSASPTPAPVSLPPREPSEPMEGIEFTPTVSPAPAPLPVPTPALTATPTPVATPVDTPKRGATPIEKPKPMPAPLSVTQPTSALSMSKITKLKIKTGGLKAAPPTKPTPATPTIKAAPTQKATPTHKSSKLSKTKKSRIVILRLPSDRLRALADGNIPSKKRKADSLAAGQRPAKRQSTEPSLRSTPTLNGIGDSRNGTKKARVEIEKVKGERPRLLLKFKSDRLPAE